MVPVSAAKISIIFETANIPVHIFDLQGWSADGRAAGTGKTLRRCHTFVVRGKDDYVDAIRNETSADFFKIYVYDFVSGRSFTHVSPRRMGKSSIVKKEGMDWMYFLALKELYGKVIVHVALIYIFTNTKARVFTELQ